ncbi:MULTISPECIES: hypothetical protein [Bacillus subtilis group]|uniref:hypothetical protein n=1 Tax=Bacillus subtilis group TaxID=653685 RepID=UPI0009B75CAD|nr:MULTISPECIES: hypothetical protein [Bacillus subtilis group]ARC74947.1 hypothetical protein B37_02922 [Bacillus licheniformis]ARW44096.1 hypothetical protein S100141_02801 [Bacillus licheniformis]ARW55456.1 hypothetical protein S100027_03487 [Bacillus licheniformis]AXF90030.1 hypothetical protein BLDA23_17840 [Bacillus licheniformis]MBU5327507.1 hypothetical protein [Bacillus paralicheniformis]
MKKYGVLFFALLLCFTLSACGNSSSNANSKEQEKDTTAAENKSDNSNNTAQEEGSKKKLDKVGDSLHDPNTGTVTLNAIKDISNKKLTIGDLNLKFIDAKVITVTDISDSFKEDLEQCFGVRPKEFTYAQIRYKTQNTGKEDISWRGFRKAVTSEGQQVDLDFNLNLGIPNPSSIDMMPNSKLEENMVWVPVNKGEKNIRLKGEDVLKKDNSKEDFIVYGKEIKIDL